MALLGSRRNDKPNQAIAGTPTGCGPGVVRGCRVSEADQILRRISSPSLLTFGPMALQQQALRLPGNALEQGKPES